MTTSTPTSPMSTSPPGSRYSRVTVTGSRRRMDIVLPSGEPVGLLLPDLIGLLQEPVGRPPRLRQLVNGGGEVLPADATLAGAGVLDGAVLRLVGVDDSPPAPIVHDITEETANDLDAQVWRWNPTARRWAVTSLVVALTAATAALGRGLLPGMPGTVELVLSALLCIMTGTALVQWREPVGTAVLLCGVVSALEAAWALGTLAGWTMGQLWTLLAAVLCSAVAMLGAATPLGRGGLIGGGVGLALVLLWCGGGIVGLPPDRTAAVLAVVVVVLLGLLPRLTLVSTGLTQLDDARVDGQDVARRGVRSALAATHRGLALAVVVMAGSAALSGWLLAGNATRWSVALACLLGGIVVSKGRDYPLISEVLAAWVSAGVIGSAVLSAWLRHTGGASLAMLSVLAGGLILTLVCLGWRPSDHVRARLRRIADWVETALIIAVVPAVIGVFGIYGRLLHTF